MKSSNAPKQELHHIIKNRNHIAFESELLHLLRLLYTLSFSDLQTLASRSMHSLSRYSLELAKCMC